MWPFRYFITHLPTTTMKKILTPSRIALIVALLILSFFVFLLIPARKASNKVSTTENSERPFTAELQIRYRELHQINSEWFFVEVPEGHFIEKAADLAWKRGEEIRSLLARYSSVSPETEEVWNNFHNFGATVQLDERSTAARPDEMSAQGLKQGKELAFLPQSLASLFIQNNMQGALLSWRPDLGISIAAFEWPERFLAGALYHELLHGKRHPVKNPPQPQLDPASLAYAIEETEAHRVESMVLNATTNGEYFKKFDEIIRRTSGDPEDCVRAITLEDLKSFDKMLKMENACGFVAAFAFAQHTVGLGVYQMERLHRPKEEWGRFFLWMRKNM